MNVILICIAVAAGIGLIIGFGKGFNKVKAWANDLILATIATVAIMGWLSKNMPQWLLELLTRHNVSLMLFNSAVTLVLCVLLLLLFTFISFRAKRFFEKGIANRKRLSYYKQYEDKKENDEDILEALDSKNERRYRKLAKHRFKESSGAIGVLNRFCGGITLAIKGAVIVALAAAAVCVVFDFVQLGEIPVISEVLADPVWGSIKIYVFDFFVVGLILLCLRCGFSGGLFSPLWIIFILALIAGAGYVSYHLAFNVSDFAQLSQGLAQNISSTLQPITDLTSKFGVTTELIAKILVTVFIFVLTLIPIILIGVFGPKLLERARDSKIFKGIDGVLGAIVALALVLALLLAAGKVLYDMNDLDFMSKFNEYVKGSAIADAFYTNNILNLYIITNFRSWFV